MALPLLSKAACALHQIPVHAIEAGSDHASQMLAEALRAMGALRRAAAHWQKRATAHDGELANGLACGAPNVALLLWSDLMC